MNFRYILALIALAAAGFLGAKISVMVRQHECHPLWILITTQLSAMIWIWQARNKDVSLAQASVLFDVVYGVSYFLGFVFLGQVTSVANWIGMLLAFASVVFMSL